MTHPVFKIEVEDNFYSRVGADGHIVMSEEKVKIAMDLIRLLGILDVKEARQRLDIWTEEIMKYEPDFDIWV